MTDDQITALLRTRGSPALSTIGGQVLAYSQERGEVTMSFEATPEMCHSRIIVQGGFITAMVDSAMAYAAMGASEGRAAVPTLEIKVSFIKAGNPGTLTSRARVVRLGKTIGFLEAELYQRDALIATSSSTIRILRRD